ncbi:BlaI/MecI/CopY family transcriptional regulator [Subsaximicrobium wynnwilliamsii]|uniref:BlaI/MecI/CopY family transcriptional regulator n=1 Tax=Subsaximicrobium wynnwilliamsii TaxID=291179 RepID=A0A5C6ZMF7_9FLAO|nr:BlaI/MecI/CopY family transcriptional regulator [Subsaximicrobium wynnwilliamsii]TXD84820.1 BlaI/MecI/CopY family transcriptional regulator [Subsaximicrobium wynnwilliamsii]TXD90491.1 BlaI/MecI/CopY family transcriptional regulator [Subsaximicrobium wynnwilliamsii]TXE04966.1 BlaI/MecI/CopY family transcriptional regulator [Subsaximicrobium wynnwilliamsii]
MDIKQLNRTELQIMKYIWQLKSGFMKDIVEQFPEPRPAYTTISTLLKRMCDKEYIGFKRLGRDKEYFPILKKNAYLATQLNGMIDNFFNDSKSQFASFFTKNADLSLQEMEELQALLEQKISSKKSSE